ncbi:MAG TPA: DUF1570 domain-containing protein [Planctomycetota bacterium]|nr:DUF1570 domain-containing protein [Planctomycetota bacterium]
MGPLRALALGLALLLASPGTFEDGAALFKKHDYLAARPLLEAAAAAPGAPRATVDRASFLLARIAYFCADDAAARAALGRIEGRVKGREELDACLGAPFGAGVEVARGRAGGFYVETDLGPPAVEEIGGYLRQIQREYQDLLPIEHDPRLVPRVLVFQGREAFLAFARALGKEKEHAAGFYMPGLRALVVDASPHGEAIGCLHRRGLMTIFHEGFHQHLRDALPKLPPPWFDEGIAEYFGPSVPTTGAERLEVGVVLKKIPGEKSRYERIVAALAPGAKHPPPPLRELLGLGVAAFRDDETRAVCYAQAWSFVHYLLRGRPDGKQRLRAYFGALREGADALAARDAAFGDVDWDALDAAWRAYVRGL